MSSLRHMVVEILMFKVTLSEQNQQNWHFGHFWACIKFHFFFQRPPFWLKLLRFKHIFIFQNFTLVSQAVLGIWWSKVLKNANFSTKITMKVFQKFFWKKVVLRVLDLGELDNSQLCWTPFWKPFYENFLLIFWFGWKIGVF